VKREPRGPSVKIGSELPMIPDRSTPDVLPGALLGSAPDEVASPATAGATVSTAMPMATVRVRRVLRMVV
jgi:hypothetical protein